MVLMPMTCPYSLISGPPELPLFSAAVVWSMVMALPSMVTRRSMAEMIPWVSVPRSSTPSGLPMAYTVSPTQHSSLSPSTAVGRSSASTAFSTARSSAESKPTSSASYCRASASTTRTDCPSAITWALVTM